MRVLKLVLINRYAPSNSDIWNEGRSKSSQQSNDILKAVKIKQDYPVPTRQVIRRFATIIISNSHIWLSLSN